MLIPARIAINSNDAKPDDKGLSNQLIQLASDKFKNIKDEKALKIIVAQKNELEEKRLTVSAKALIVSNWKNGCDLIGDILSQHPGTFYHYEPLAFHGVKRFVDEYQDELATNILRSLLKCNYGPSLGKTTTGTVFPNRQLFMQLLCLT